MTSPLNPALHPPLHTSALLIPIQRLPHGEGLDLPLYATAGSVGLDLCAAIPGEQTLLPGHRSLVPSGFAIAVPEGFEAQVRGRSGLAIKHGVVVLNSPGTIDPDYRGELGIILINHGQEPFTLTRGMRIAQLIIAPVARATWTLCETLPQATTRGMGGFGSTGI